MSAWVTQCLMNCLTLPLYKLTPGSATHIWEKAQSIKPESCTSYVLICQFHYWSICFKSAGDDNSIRPKEFSTVAVIKSSKSCLCLYNIHNYKLMIMSHSITTLDMEHSQYVDLQASLSWRAFVVGAAMIGQVSTNFSSHGKALTLASNAK